MPTVDTPRLSRRIDDNKVSIERRDERERRRRRVHTTNRLNTSGTSTEQLDGRARTFLQSLGELATAVAALADRDAQKTRGTAEMATRARAVRDTTIPQLTERLIAMRRDAGVRIAIEAVQTVLRRARDELLPRVLATSFRRNARCKASVAEWLRDCTLAVTGLGNAVSLAYASRAATKSPPIRGDADDAEQQCLAADRAFFGHGEEKNVPRAANLYQVAARTGNVRAMRALATLLRNGGRETSSPRASPPPVRCDPKQALEWLERAAAAGDVAAAVMAANMHETGEGLSQPNLERALALYLQAARGGDRDACNSLGYLYEHGGGDASHVIDADVDAAMAWYREAAARGCGKAMSNVGMMYLRGAVAPVTDGLSRDATGTHFTSDPTEAMSWFHRAVQETNDASAFFNLGAMYENGRAGMADVSLAEANYERAMDQGHVKAMIALATMYLRGGVQVERGVHLLHRAIQTAQGKGAEAALYLLGMVHLHGMGPIARDGMAACDFFRRAAAIGHGPACYSLGDASYAGVSGTTDATVALSWYRKAAQRGVMAAFNAVGLLLEEGVGNEGVPDLAGAAAAYERAADAGVADACLNLGLLLERGGDGIARDLPRAQRLFVDSATRGSESARLYLESKKNGKKEEEEATQHAKD